MPNQEDFDQAFISLLSDFDQSLKLEETMDEKQINEKIKEHAGIHKAFLEEQVTNLKQELQLNLDKKLESFTLDVKSYVKSKVEKPKEELIDQMDH